MDFGLKVILMFTENALAQQACVLRAQLEKSLQDNASLFLKIGKAANHNLQKRRNEFLGSVIIYF